MTGTALNPCARLDLPVLRFGFIARSAVMNLSPNAPRRRGIPFATLTSVPAGHLADRLDARRPVRVPAGGVAAFALAYGLFAITGPAVVVLAVPFVLAGIGGPIDSFSAGPVDRQLGPGNSFHWGQENRSKPAPVRGL
jgi:hypothetical protein